MYSWAPKCSEDTECGFSRSHKVFFFAFGATRKSRSFFAGSTSVWSYYDTSAVIEGYSGQKYHCQLVRWAVCNLFPPHHTHISFNLTCNRLSTKISMARLMTTVIVRRIAFRRGSKTKKRQTDVPPTWHHLKENINGPNQEMKLKGELKFWRIVLEGWVHQGRLGSISRFQFASYCFKLVFMFLDYQKCKWLCPLWATLRDDCLVLRARGHICG